MAYTKNTWADGDIVTSENLNHMEEGIANAGGVMVVGGVTFIGALPTGTLDKTWQEIYNALAAGVSVALIIEDSSVPVVMRDNITTAYVNDGKYIVNLSVNKNNPKTDSASGYPSFSGGPV